MLIILPSKETLGVFVEDFLPLEMCSRGWVGGGVDSSNY